MSKDPRGKPRIGPKGNKLPAKIITVVICITTAVSSLAAISTPSLPVKPVGLNPADLVKYQQLSAQSQVLTTGQAAGASSTTKTVLITVGVVAIVVAAAVSSPPTLDNPLTYY